MTSPDFASTLRRLHGEASAAPWNTCSACHKPDGKPCGLIWSHGDDVLVAAAHGEDMAESHGDPWPGDALRRANAAAIVTLRNAAPDVAALVEAAGALRHYDDPTVLLKAAELAPMFAALDALNGTVKS